ncbi:MAG TPA: hypothetical protein VG297_15680 [Bryobacteraceae bacterium]|jgi:hypothetical protein|nr:hypothetical protein [Bryobacteraceae bacterium]
MLFDLHTRRSPPPAAMNTECVYTRKNDPWVAPGIDAAHIEVPVIRRDDEQIGLNDPPLAGGKSPKDGSVALVRDAEDCGNRIRLPGAKNSCRPITAFE